MVSHKRALLRGADEHQSRQGEARYRGLFDNMIEELAYCRMVYDAAGRPADSRPAGRRSPRHAPGAGQLLYQEGDIEVVGEAGDGQMAIDLAMRLGPDVILMDVSMPTINGIEATRIIHGEQPGVKIVGLSMFQEKDQADAMLGAGAAAYLTKTGAAETLIDTIRSFAQSREPVGTTADEPAGSRSWFI